MTDPRHVNRIESCETASSTPGGAEAKPRMADCSCHGDAYNDVLDMGCGEGVAIRMMAQWRGIR
jgi:hypothetical protein